MSKIRLTFAGKCLIGLVAAGILWGLFSERQRAARIQELASLKPCRLVREYIEWRIEFDDATGTGEITGGAAEEFVDESEVFEQAARRARSNSSSAALKELEAVTSIDSRKDVYQMAPAEQFLEVATTECPDVLALVVGSDT